MEDLAGPNAGFSDIGVLEEGECNVDDIRAQMSDATYMMKLKETNAEENAIGVFKPIWQLLRYNDTTLTKSQSQRAYKGLMQRCWITKSKKSLHGCEITHTDMTGASYHIPFTAKDPSFPLDTYETYIKLYAAVTSEGAKHWTVERYTPVFRFFMDLDFEQPEIIQEKKIEVVCFIVSRTVRTFWPSLQNDSFRIICCTTSSKKTPCTGCMCSCIQDGIADKACLLCKGQGATGKSNKDKACDVCAGIIPVKKKTGVHIIWPNLFVTDEQCLDIRESVIADLIKTFGQRVHPFNDWSSVVDAAVYKKNGLRMVGARKAGACSKCQKKRKIDGVDCSHCRATGFQDDGRPYSPLFVTDGTFRRDLDKENEYKTNYHLLIQDTKIRYEGLKTEGYTLPENAPTHVTAGYDKHFKTKHDKTPTRQTRVAPDTPEAQAIQHFFQQTCTTLQPKFKDLIVTSIMKCSKASYLINVTGHGCTFCQNIGRAHKSNRIFFLATPDGVIQRCHDTADKIDAEMKYGLCKDYRSAPLPLPLKTIQLLFPNESQQAAQEGPGNVDTKLLSLLDAGNKLCRDLFNVEWSSSNRFSSLNGQQLIQMQGGILHHERAAWMKAHTAIFKSYMPDCLGTRDDTIMEELEFADKKDTVQYHQPKEKQHYINIRKLIESAIDSILGAALSGDIDVVTEKLQRGLSYLHKTVKAKKPRLANSPVDVMDDC